jgi:hypothetical protein
MSEQPIFKGRTTCTTTIYEAPSYDATKLGEFEKGSLFRLASVQRENEVNWCKVQTDDGRGGYLVGFLVEVCRECTIAQDRVPIYDLGKTQIANLARGTAIRAWLPPESNLETFFGEDRNAWIEVERDNTSGYIRGTQNLRVPSLPRARPTGPTEPASFIKVLQGVVTLVVIAGLGIFILGKVIGMFLTSRAAYTISAVALGSWLALKTFGRSR